MPVWCGKWTCPKCSKRNATLWAWRARLEVEQHDGKLDYFFITLTLPGNYKHAKQGYANIPKIFNRVRMWVSRAIAPDKWHYLAFVEGQPHRGGMPHFHIISGVSIAFVATGKNQHGKRKLYGTRNKIRIKDWAVARGFGFEADESRINGPQASQYVAKYASKQDPRMPKGFRRVRASHNWAKLPEFEGDPLIVRSRKEHTQHYLIRVSDITGIGLDELYARYQGALVAMAQKT